jgi:hypothetical protein
VGSIRVDAVGLSALAAHCEQQAELVGSIAVAADSGGGFQPSAVAVQAAHADVVAAGARLMARMQSTAAAASTAAVGYVTTDSASAGGLAAVIRASTTAV